MCLCTNNITYCDPQVSKCDQRFRAEYLQILAHKTKNVTFYNLSELTQ